MVGEINVFLVLLFSDFFCIFATEKKMISQKI